MLRKTRDLKGCRLGAQDGEIGHVKDLYFDDHTWTVRYLVGDTGRWLPARRVLISPFAVKGIHFAAHKVIELALTKQQIEQSPSIELHKPISRQFEAQYARHFGWPYYWAGPLLWGSVAAPGSYLPYSVPSESHVAESTPLDEDSHLWSAAAVAGYSIQALDQHFGHIDQFIVDDEDWAIRYVVADLRIWLPGKRVLLAPQWISSVIWAESRVYIDFDRATIKRSPAYDPALPISREQEKRLFEHYNRPPYWERKVEPALTGIAQFSERKVSL